MSDYDNLREDEYERKLEASNEARDAAMEFHCENWFTAVTDSPEKSNGVFDDVTDFEAVKRVRLGELTSLPYPKRKANSVDVFIEELHNADFLERAAKILIDIYSSTGCAKYIVGNKLEQLFDDMAHSYAEFQYESNIED